jgi:tRNA nucleotidyltransferase/poly(A) polymerase
LTANKNRVLRAIYLACKLDFEVSPEIIEFVKTHPESVKIATPKSTTDKLHQAFKFNPKKATQLITEMGIWGHIPIIEPARPYYQQSVKWHNV